MAVIKRGQVAAPTLPKETVGVDALGGEVVVRGLLLTERLDLEARIAQQRRDAVKAKADGKVKDDGPTAGDLAVPMLLSRCVQDADGLELWTEEQWQAFGCRYQDQALQLFNVAWRLSGFKQDDAAKN
jgi:hypothetical protein